MPNADALPNRPPVDTAEPNPVDGVDAGVLPKGLGADPAFALAKGLVYAGLLKGFTEDCVWPVGGAFDLGGDAKGFVDGCC